MQGGNHFALNISADRHTEALAERSPYRGSGLNHNVLCRVGKSLPNLVGIVLFGERACRADNGTLTAGNTRNLRKANLKGGADCGVDTAVISAYYAYILLLAGGNTAAAKHALVVIPYKVGSGLVKRVNRLEALKSGGVNAVIAAELLKLAVGGTNAGKTLFIVGRKNKL